MVTGGVPEITGRVTPGAQLALVAPPLPLARARGEGGPVAAAVASGRRPPLRISPLGASPAPFLPVPGAHMLAIIAAGPYLHLRIIVLAASPEPDAQENGYEDHHDHGDKADH
jgi:hypothetical protein